MLSYPATSAKNIRKKVDNVIKALKWKHLIFNAQIHLKFKSRSRKSLIIQTSKNNTKGFSRVGDFFGLL